MWLIIFSKGANTIQKGKDSNRWENWISTCKRIKLNPYLTSNTKMNTKWMKHSNVGLKTIKLLEENIGEKLHDLIWQ